MRLRNAFLVAGYALLVSYALERPGWLAGLSIIGPTVILIPVFVILAKLKSTTVDYVTYSAAGLLGACTGFGLALYQGAGEPYRAMALLSTVGMAAYAAPVLALFVTIFIWAINSRRDVPEGPSGTKKFYVGAAWVSLVAVVLVGEAYVFGVGAKQCGGLWWGFYTIMLSPAFIITQPLRAIAGVIVFCVGGVLPRFLKVNPRVALATLVLLVVAAAVLGVTLTPVSETACSPI